MMPGSKQRQHGSFFQEDKKGKTSTPRIPSTPKEMPINKFIVSQTVKYLDQLNNPKLAEQAIQALFNIGLETRKSTPAYLKQLNAEQQRHIADFTTDILGSFVVKVPNANDKTELALEIVKSGYTLINTFHEHEFGRAAAAGPSIPGNN